MAQAVAAAPALAVGGPVPSQADLVAMFDVARRLFDVAQMMVLRALATDRSAMLTAAEFAERLGGGISPDTVNGWCRDRAFGKFAEAENWGKAGWRIPEYYLWYTDNEWAELRRRAVTPGEVVVPTSAATPTAAVTSEAAAPAPVGSEEDYDFSAVETLLKELTP
ncbi:MAG TPA: hypothetical protein VFS40_12490 [Gemmatimonadales bacterium]|nr:hypothetical protein [Gemmatimonadales bacterium]